MSVRIIIFAIASFFFFENYAFAKYYGATLCHTSPDYVCHTIKRGETWQKLFPDATQRDLIMRINRRNEPLSRGLIIAIPKSASLNVFDYSPLPQKISPPGSKIIYVSIQKQAFGAYDSDGTLQHWGPISSALGYCPDIGKSCRTPTGNFSIQSKEGADCVSSKFPVGRGGAPMAYCMFFHKGYALHGSELPGYNASHGCIRLFTPDAKWLNKEFTAADPHMPVIVNP